MLALALLLSLLPLGNTKLASAHPGKLTWSIVDTPASGQPSNIIVSPSEINAIAVGSDGSTLYALDIPGDLPAGIYPNGKVYKSTDGGITWQTDLTDRLTTDGASLPAWNIAVAPDNVDFIVAIVDDAAPAINGPLEIFISEDGGENWDNTNFGVIAGLGPNEYISYVDISIEYSSGKRDIAIGTRTGTGNGRIYILEVGDIASTWTTQGLIGDIVALRFSPNYSGDLSIIAITATGLSITLNLGFHDIVVNNTTWNTPLDYPVSVFDAGYPGNSPNAGQIITADLELPSDFSGTDPGYRRYYISTDASGANIQSGIYRVDDTVTYWISHNIGSRISSIAYSGTYSNGKLIAGEVVTPPSSSCMADVWYCSNPISNTPDWNKSNNLKSPTGGGNSSYTNAQVMWCPDGEIVYCGTSSSDFASGGTSMVAGSQCWPEALLNSVPLDESAFSISFNDGVIWNQYSLIDTAIGFLSDISVMEVTEDSDDSDILYLASINNAATPGNFDFDSVWRSTSDPLGDTWERVLCTNTSDNGTILRPNSRVSEEGNRSHVIVYADLFTNDIKYSDDDGQEWESYIFNLKVIDITLANDIVMYILDETFVHKIKRDCTWKPKIKVDTMLGTGHTITTPSKSPTKEGELTEDWVIVGESGPPDGEGRVAYADFSIIPPEFKPPPQEQVSVPVPGNIHVIADDKFHLNKTIYAASNDTNSGTSGKIYRWTIDKSTDWDELEPPNNAFYGLAQESGVLYGAWDTTLPFNTPPGVDRTLYPKRVVPPPPEWDDLTTGLPILGDVNYPVSLTREPNSLKTSSDIYNNLWAIDNRDYDWDNKIGCLWAYTDTLVKVGPWTTSPASGDFIPIDPVTGRATEINFGWRQLSYALRYELQLAKREDFSLQVIGTDNITPPESLSPAWILPPGVLEVNHPYYWRVRAIQGTTGEIIHSPWSATMLFIVKAGLPTVTEYLGPILLKPVCGAKGISPSPSFSWSPIPGTQKYEFILAEDAALTSIIAQATTSTTAYEYDGKLDRNSAYFWRVRALEPFVSEPSPVAGFIVTGNKEISATAIPSPSTSFWIWIMIAIYTVLVVTLIGFIKARLY